MRSIKGLADEISWLEHSTEHSSYRNTKYVFILLCWANKLTVTPFWQAMHAQTILFINQINFLNISDTAQKAPFFRAYSWPCFKQNLQEIMPAYGGILNCPFYFETGLDQLT